MLSELFNCPFCHVPFDKITHTPKIISNCGHTLCVTCLSKTIKDKKICPLDNKKLPKQPKQSCKYQTNQLVLQIIEERLNIGCVPCSRHGKLKNMACVTDRCLICEQCASEHLGHKTKSISELKSEAQDKKKKLECLLSSFDHKKKNVETILDDLKKSTVLALKKEFDQIREEIQRKEKELTYELEYFFEKIRTNMDEIFRESHITEERCRIKIFDLEQQISERFLRSLEKLETRFPTFKEKTRLDNLLSRTHGITKKFISSLQVPSEGMLDIIKDTHYSQAINLLSKYTEDIEISLKSEEYEEYDLIHLNNLFKITVDGYELNITQRDPLKAANSPIIMPLPSLNWLKS